MRAPSPIPASVQPPVEKDILGRTEDRYTRILKDLLTAKEKVPGERVVTASAKRFTEKRAALQNTPLEKTAVGEQAGAKILSELLSTKGVLIGSGLLGLGALTAPALERLGYGARAITHPSLYDRMRMDEEAATSFAKEVGKKVGGGAIGLFGDLLSKAVGIPAGMMQERRQKGLFDQLRQDDDVLSQARPEDLEEAYHTMARFAPTLATDSNAVKTFLRESTLYGTGPNFTSIKQLADAERAVNPAQMLIKAKD